ncbi:hypothetical protein MML48_5g00006532 [Holotrichia oblita]|uniref:Uncharacterized protein n=1 Tax=Holotrichia oblita TaxID=644536 RepID=A0ACB9T4A9_HOLOL|nr:hypothetical protein MML48_5g00006532 [Holotrichia oblita]
MEDKLFYDKCKMLCDLNITAEQLGAPEDYAIPHSNENKIPIIENEEIIPILMIVIIRSKLIHIYSNMYYIEKFLWKLQESTHIQNIITIFKTAIVQIESLSNEDIRPSSGKIRKHLDFVEVTNIMAGMESKSETQTNSLLNNHVKRVRDLIFTSTNNTNIN